MSWEQLAQNRIEEAIAQGGFDDLPGRGPASDQRPGGRPDDPKRLARDGFKVLVEAGVFVHMNHVTPTIPC